MSFVVRVDRVATYRLVPEDRRLGSGVNIPFFLEDMTGQTADGRMNVILRASSVATYVEGLLSEIVVPEGWRVEQWPDGAEADDDVVFGYLRDRTE